MIVTQTLDKEAYETAVRRAQNMKYLNAVRMGTMLIGVLLLMATVALYFSGRGHETSIALALAGSLCGFATAALNIAVFTTASRQL
ncbi:hypothetical protein MnBA_39480 [Marinobacterium sp. BA1]